MTALAPTCPRCDYDLSGLIATWTLACPIEATCSECGLAFDSGRVLSPRLLGPPWSFEHSHAPSMRRRWRTACISLAPRRCFHELNVDHRIRVDRLLRFALLWLLLVHLVAFAAAFASVVFAGAGLPRWWARSRPGFAIDPSDLDFWFTMLRTLVFPYDRPLAIPTGVSSYTMAPLGPIFFVVVAPLLLMPGWMLILSTSMQQARVRKAHLIRGLCLSIPGGLAFVVLALGAITIAALFRNVLDIDPSFVGIAFTTAWIGYHMNWWFVFIRRYLRLRHAAAVVLLNSVMSALLILLVVVIAGLIGMRI